MLRLFHFPIEIFKMSFHTYYFYFQHIFNMLYTCLNFFKFVNFSKKSLRDSPQVFQLFSFVMQLIISEMNSFAFCLFDQLICPVANTINHRSFFIWPTGQILNDSLYCKLKAGKDQKWHLRLNSQMVPFLLVNTQV